MVVLLRGVAALAVMALGAGAATGCGGLSKSEADLRCNQEQAAKGDVFDDKSYASCEQCYESCGDSCTSEDTSPARYTCNAPSGGETTATP